MKIPEDERRLHCVTLAERRPFLLQIIFLLFFENIFPGFASLDVWNYAPLVIPPPLIKFFRSKSGVNGKDSTIHWMVLPGSQVDLL